MMPHTLLFCLETDTRYLRIGIVGIDLRIGFNLRIRIDLRIGFNLRIGIDLVFSGEGRETRQFGGALFCGESGAFAISVFGHLKLSAGLQDKFLARIQVSPAGLGDDDTKYVLQSILTIAYMHTYDPGHRLCKSCRGGQPFGNFPPSLPHWVCTHVIDTCPVLTLGSVAFVMLTHTEGLRGVTRIRIGVINQSAARTAWSQSDRRHFSRDGQTFCVIDARSGLSSFIAGFSVSSLHGALAGGLVGGAIEQQHAFSGPPTSLAHHRLAIHLSLFRWPGGR